MEQFHPGLEQSSKQSYETCNSENFNLIKYETIEYRGQTVDLLSDICGDNYYFKWNNNIVDLGIHPINVKEAVCAFLDRKLDLISTFSEYGPEFEGAYLSYFNNSGYRDIALKYKGRVLRVFLVSSDVNETMLVENCKNILLSSGLLDSKNEIL